MLPFEVQPLVFETIANIDDCINTSIDDDLLVSYLALFCLMDGELICLFSKLMTGLGATQIMSM